MDVEADRRKPLFSDGPSERLTELYLELLKHSLSGYLDVEEFREVAAVGWKAPFIRVLRHLLARRDIELLRRHTINQTLRSQGRDWPAHAVTMIGLRRLENLQFCITNAVRSGVPGDLIETGVWRGGATIFMRGVLEAIGDTDRNVWVADSFRGLPKPDTHNYPADAGGEHWSTYKDLAVPIEEVKRNFARYSLLDERVRFLQGWFRDTLPRAPIQRLAVLRLDGDMYESTMVALQALYPKLSAGGFAIIDDYGDVPECRKAVEDYRAAHGVQEPVTRIDAGGVFWQRGHR